MYESYCQISVVLVHILYGLPQSQSPGLTRENWASWLSLEDHVTQTVKRSILVNYKCLLKLLKDNVLSHGSC